MSFYITASNSPINTIHTITPSRAVIKKKKNKTIKVFSSSSIVALKTKNLNEKIETKEINNKNNANTENKDVLNKILNEVLKITEENTAKDIGKILKETNKDLPKEKRVQHGNSMTLYRGCRPDQMAKILITGSAGGIPANRDTGKPTEDEALRQVGELESIPEFTSSYHVSKSFGRGQLVIAVSIEKQYLKSGSGVESGMVCKADAPITLLAWRPGPKFDFPIVHENQRTLAEKGHVISNNNLIESK